MNKERFLAKTERNGSCLLWRGAKQNSGYGHLTVGGKTVLAHRHSHALFVAPIAAGLQVNHTCDNKLCVEPTHLWAGTQAENIQDASRKGRLEPRRHARGERHGLAKLDWDKVKEIRELHRIGYTERRLAAKFGVGHNTIHQVVAHETWQEALV